MPEIYECFFGLAELLRFIPQEDNKIDEKLYEFESETHNSMFENRLKLFTDYGYTRDFERAF